MQSRAKVKGKGRKWVAFGAVTVVSPGWTGLDEWCKERENVGMWACGTEGERKHSITPGNARTFANPTCGRRRREAININMNSGFVQYYYYYYYLINTIISSYVCDFVLFCFALLLLFLLIFVFFPRYTRLYYTIP